MKNIEAIKKMNTDEPTYAIYLGKLLKYAQFCSKSEES